MPILGALAVIDRIEKVMKEGFPDSIRTIESNLVVEGALTGLDPAIPIPTDLEYGRDEDPATDTVTSVITRCNSSEITNEPSNHGDLHWQHEMVVEVITVAEVVANERLFTSTHIYGAALVQLFGAARPCMEMGGAQTNDGFKSPVSTFQLLPKWSNPDNILLSDDARAATGDRAQTHELRAQFTLSDHLPAGPVVIVGVEVKVEGFCDDADAENRKLIVNLQGGDGSLEIGATPITKTLVESASSDGFASYGGSSVMWGLDAITTARFGGTEQFYVTLQPQELTGGVMKIDHVQLKVYYKLLAPWDGAIVNNIGPVRYRNEFNEAGAFWIRSASVVMEVQRREING